MNERIGLFVVSIDRAWFVDYTFVIFEKIGWIITNILAKKSSIFEAKRYCARPFLVITFHAAAHETVLPPLFRIRFRRGRTLGSGCDLRFPPLPASSLIIVYSLFVYSPPPRKPRFICCLVCYSVVVGRTILFIYIIICDSLFLKWFLRHTNRSYEKGEIIFKKKPLVWLWAQCVWMNV